jgi:NADH:ubiquinone oxidoreductase subunit H
MDPLFQNVIESWLKFRHDRIVADLPIWPWSFWIILFGFIVLLVVVLLVVLYTTLLERKLLGWIQVRLGPNRVGPWGLLQPFADMIKLLIKEDIVPCAADKWFHLIAPLVIFIPTMLAFVVIPFGKGTVELPQEYVAPTFDSMWVEWLSPEDAALRGYPQPGWLEAAVAVHSDPATHKTWWEQKPLDHDPLFAAAPDDEYKIPIDARYRIRGVNVLELPKTNAQAPATYQAYYLLVDYGSSGRKYDVLELRWLDSSGHRGVIEFGLNGQLIDDVENTYTKIIEGIGPDVPIEQRYDFGDKTPEKTILDLYNQFADAVAINNRQFGPTSMVPAFTSREEKKLSWRDLYTPDLRHVAFLHGAVSREERKASLYFFPAALEEGGGTEANQPSTSYDIDTLNWRTAGAAFRVQRAAGGGYTIEPANTSMPAAMLSKPGDSIELPLGDSQVRVTLKDRQYYNFYLMGKNLGIGILYLFAVTSLTVLGIFMAGFGANNKWSLYGAMRSVAQMMSYEIPMTLAVLGPILMTGSLSMVDLVEAQRSSWFVLPQFIAFFIFLVCMTAEVNRNPFDLPEAESELVAGFHTEYSGLKFAFFFLAEYANMFVAAAVMTVLFFGGCQGPTIPFVGEFVSSFFWFMLKVFFWLCVFVWFRGTFPRFRIDQLMDYAWKVLLPLALVNVIMTGYFTYSDWYFPIWRENNWRIWTLYVRTLFVNKPTIYFAIPIIVVIALIFVVELFGMYWDRARSARRAKKPY